MKVFISSKRYNNKIMDKLFELNIVIYFEDFLSYYMKDNDRQ